MQQDKTFDPNIIGEDVSESSKIVNGGSDNEKDNQSKKKGFFSKFRIGKHIGIVLILVGTILFFSFFSYLRTGFIDQSVVLQHSSVDTAYNSGIDSVKNWIGSFGAEVSYMFINEGVGISAFLIALWLILVGLKLVIIKKIKVYNVTVYSLILIAALSLVFGLISVDNDSFIKYGGNLGHYVSLFLVKFIGTLGTLLLYGALLLSVVIASFGRIISFYRYVKNLLPSKKKSENVPVSEVVEEEPEPINFPEVAYEPEDQFEESLDSENQEDEGEDSEYEVGGDDVTETFEDKEGVEVSDGDIKVNIVNAPTIEKADKINKIYDPSDSLPRYKFPSTSLLKNIKIKENNVDKEEQEENKKRITETLNNYGINIKSIDVCVGPTITLFEIVPADGVRIAKIKNLENDIALSLAALGIRIIAPIPGRGTIGIEVPNRDPQTVSMRSVLESKTYQESKFDLPIAMGCTIANKVFVADLCKMPHVLVAGATGQGKSVGLNAIITSLIYRKHPAELKFVLFDPKMVEFSLYARLEHHYLAKLPGEEEPIVTDFTKAIATLNSLTVLMDNRYELLKNAKVRNIKEYNEKFVNHRLNPDKGHEYMPYIVVVVDEFADLIMMAGKEVEKPIARIAQKARAVGIHMIIATQRPSTDVITGMIKANFPGRIAFKVSQMVDSRTILDCPGAQQLIGRGDMLFLANGEMERVQCAFISTEEAESICEFIGNQIGYATAYELPEFIPSTEEDVTYGGGGIADRDSLFEEAAAFIVTGTTASTSSLQRRYSIGYNRAGKIMDQLEAAGIVGPAQGGKPRQVLMDSLQLSQILNN